MFGSQNVGAMYDSWLLKQADDYMTSGCDGEPEVIDSYQEYEGRDSDGNTMTSTTYVYNCGDCDCTECEHWKDFHQDEGEDND